MHVTFPLQLILHLVQNHLGGLSKIVLHGNKVKKSTVDAIKTYLRENHMDTESETTTDLDLTLSSITSETTSDDSSQNRVIIGMYALTWVEGAMGISWVKKRSKYVMFVTLMLTIWCWVACYVVLVQ